MTDVKSILLVEDSAQDRELTIAALGEHHLANQVVPARDGAEALDYVFRRGAWAERPPGHPAVILLDLKMPKVDGVEVLRALKSNEDTRAIPVVVLTSSREEPDLRECYRLGVNAYVVKPVDFQAFMNAVKDLGTFWAILNEPPPGSVRRSP